MEIDLKINYSVIIPHKNIPELLDRCLQSIPIRDDVQIIVVDDNSDPDKVDFSKFPGLERPNTEVYFTKEGKGAGYARNVGLSNAKGKWLVFADADDFFNECLNDMFDKYKNVEADIVFFQSNSVDNNTLKPIESRTEKHNVWLRKSHKTGIILDEIRYKIFHPWSKFYSHNFINDNCIYFDEVFTSNDVMFSTISGYYANKILIDLNYIYCSSIRLDSLQHTLSKNNLEPRLYTSVRHYKFLLSKNKVKYRMNVWKYIFQFRKIDYKLLKKYIIYSYDNIKFRHLICDLLKHGMMYLDTHLLKTKDSYTETRVKKTYSSMRQKSNLL